MEQFLAYYHYNMHIAPPHTSFRHTFTTLLSVSKVEEIAWKQEANIKRRFPMEENEVPKLQIAHLCK